jgi:hypothetical protein
LSLTGASNAPRLEQIVKSNDLPPHMKMLHDCRSINLMFRTGFHEGGMTPVGLINPTWLHEARQCSSLEQWLHCGTSQPYNTLKNSRLVTYVPFDKLI